MNKLLKKINGVTLVELLVVIALLVIIIGVFFSIFLFSNKSFDISSNRYDVQSEVRLATDSVIKNVRFATSLEIVSVDEASNPSMYEAGFNYFYINGGNLYHIIYDGLSGSYRTITYTGHIDNSISKFSRLGASLLKIKISSNYRGQSHNGETDLSLPNLSFNGGNILGSEGLGIKYKSN